MQITNSLVFPSISINDGNIVSVIGIIVIGSVLNDICDYAQASNTFSSTLAKGCALKACIIALSGQ